MFIKIMTILTLMATLNGTPVEEHSTYVRTMEVTQLNYTQDIVTCTDAVGYTWEFYGCEDYAKGDLVACMMDTMGTENTILDDAIIDTYYTGYWVD